jgi:CRP/FNR family cyclic AMP-dependent transcriptional regulator
MKNEIVTSAGTGAQDASQLVQDLANHPFLTGLSEHHLGTLAGCAMASHFKAGEQIFREGDPANRFYLIKSGQVALETRSERGIAPVQTIGAGDVLGWSWLFPPYYWHFDARAIEPTEAVFLYGTRLREFCEEDHDLGYELMKRTANVVITRLMAARRELAHKR